MNDRTPTYWSTDEVVERVLRAQREHMWNRDHWHHVVAPLLGLGDRARVLDVGCGLGFVTRLIAACDPHARVLGIDLDPELIRQASETTVESSINERVEFRVGDACRLPVDDGAFDLVVCQTVLMHVPNPVIACREMSRVAASDARVAAIEPGGDVRYDSARAELARPDDIARWRACVDAGERQRGCISDVGTRVPSFFTQAGLRVSEVRMMDRTRWLLPPYENEGDDALVRVLSCDADAHIARLHAAGVLDDFSSGGGTPDDLAAFLDYERKEHEVRNRQLRDHTYCTVIAQPIVLTVAIKP